MTKMYADGRNPNADATSTVNAAPTKKHQINVQEIRI